MSEPTSEQRADALHYQFMEDSKRRPVLLFFTGKGCVPCANLKKELERRPVDPSKVTQFTLDAWTDPVANLVAARFNVMQVPTLIVVWEGKECLRLRGFTPQTRNQLETGLGHVLRSVG